MIFGYRDGKTERFADGRLVRGFHRVRVAGGQEALDPECGSFAPSLDTLRTLPSNRLEALGGERRGQFSIRINRQWRICFEWPDGEAGPSRVEIVDYHS